jgi:cell division protein FtsB
VKWLAIALGVVIAVLQYRLWLSDSGVRELARMQESVTQQQTQNAALVERNRQLAAEVRDLKTGMAALEERARSELGMIASNETYYQVVPAAQAAPRPTAAQVAAR